MLKHLILVLALFNIFISTQGEENVALGKNTNQSSNYLTSYSSLAVDGNNNNVYSNGHCSHTFNNGTNWWCVDLQRDIDFQNIKIYNRNRLQRSLQGFEIRFSSTSGCNEDGYQQSTVCYKDTSTTTQDIYNIDSCNQQQVQFNSRSVYISVDNTGDKYLTLCEVEIFEKCDSNCKDGCDSNGICYNCISGYYGDKCNKLCPTNCNGGCQQSNGDCEACSDGYYGNKCDTQCPTNCNGGCQQRNGNCIGGCKNGFWGLKCNDNCIKCNQGCQQNTGDCNNGGCISGYWGDKCEERCSPNCRYHTYTTCYQTSGNCYSGCKDTWYGDTCSKECSSNCLEKKCYQLQSGPVTCTTGCIGGYKGSYCQDTCLDNCISCNRYNNQCTSCKTGWYGNQCQTKCNSNCINGCNQSTGLCISCIDGYKGRYCQDTCLDNCTSCNRYNNQCTSCKTGWYGDTCQNGSNENRTNEYNQDTGRCTSCKTGWYGNQCQSKCNSNCISRCNIVTGICVDDDVNGRQYTEVLGSSDGISPVVAGIIGAVTSMVLLLIVNVILVFFCLKKRNERKMRSENEVRYTTSDNVEITRPTYENVQDDVTRSQVEAGSYYESLESTLPSPTYETLK